MLAPACTPSLHPACSGSRRRPCRCPASSVAAYRHHHRRRRPHRAHRCIQRRSKLLSIQAHRPPALASSDPRCPGAHSTRSPSLRTRQSRLQGNHRAQSRARQRVDSRPKSWRYVRASLAHHPLGSMVQILLELKPGTQPLTFPARIVRTAANDCMGLRIENAGADESRKLQEFLLPKILAKRD
jgi:hypothetical protein